MGVKEILQKITGKGSANREMVNSMANQLRLERMAQERQLSPNERELIRLRNEDREEMIKGQLDFARRKRQDDIDHGHNPLDVKNITAHTEWEILKEKNIFAKKGNMLDRADSVMKNNPNLLKTNRKLLQTNHKLLTGGSIFKI